MNRKLLVIAIVPLIVGMTGAVAFSTFQGTIVNHVTTTAGTATVYQSEQCTGGYVGPDHALTLWWNTFGGKIIGYPGEYKNPVFLSGSTPCGGTVVGPKIVFLSSWVDKGFYTVTISGFAPGDWVILNFAYTNPGGFFNALPVSLSVDPTFPGIHPVPSGLEFPIASGTPFGATFGPTHQGWFYSWGGTSAPLPSTPIVLCPHFGGSGTCGAPSPAYPSAGGPPLLYLGLSESSLNHYQASFASFTFATTATAL